MNYQILGLIAGFYLLIGPVALAADPSADSVAKYYNVDDRLDKMKSDLNLNDQQVKEIKPILENYKDKIHSARQEKEDKIDKVLTSEQKSKMDNFKKDADKLEKNWWQF